MRFALDTNTIILLLRDDPHITPRFNESIMRGDTLAVPPFVHYEMRCGFLYKPAPAKERAYSRLLPLAPVGEMTAETWEQGAKIYANLRNSGRTLDDADLLIAAFCIVNNYTLVTHNVRHFEGIDGLLVEDWSLD